MPKMDEYNFLNDELGISAKEHEDIFRWFSRQGYSVRRRILSEFAKDLTPSLSGYDLYRKFLEIVSKNGWKISKKISSKHLLRREELKIASQNEIEKALTYRKRIRKVKRSKRLYAHVGLIMELRKNGLSYDDIAMYFTNIKKIKVSRSTIANIIKREKEEKK